MEEAVPAGVQGLYPHLYTWPLRWGAPGPAESTEQVLAGHAGLLDQAGCSAHESSPLSRGDGYHFGELVILTQSH